jgi:hypothetical protein
MATNEGRDHQIKRRAIKFHVIGGLLLGKKDGRLEV